MCIYIYNNNNKEMWKSSRARLIEHENTAVLMRLCKREIRERVLGVFFQKGREEGLFLLYNVRRAHFSTWITRICFSLLAFAFILDSFILHQLHHATYVLSLLSFYVHFKWNLFHKKEKKSFFLIFD